MIGLGGQRKIVDEEVDEGRDPLIIPGLPESLHDGLHLQGRDKQPVVTECTIALYTKLGKYQKLLEN